MALLSGISHREYVGVDISDDNMRLAHVKVLPNKKEILNLVLRNIADMSDDNIVKNVRSAFGALKAKNPHVVSVVASHQAITKNIEIPSTKPNEIREIINLQAGRHTPFSREEIIVDYIEIGTYKHSYTKILLIIIARNTVKRQFDILERAGIRVEKVTLSPESITWFVPRILRISTMDSPVTVLHVDEFASDFTIILRNKPIFVRSIPMGVRRLSEGGENANIKFVDEIKRSLESYQSEDIEKSPTMLVLTGATKGLRSFEETLNNNLHLPIRSLPYERNLPLSEKTKSVLSEEQHVSFLSVISSLLAIDDLKVDLIPEEVKVRKLLEQRGKELVKTGIYLLTIIILIFFLLVSKIYFKSAYLKKLDEKYNTLNIEARQLEKEFVKVSMIKNYLSKRGFALEVLATLYDVAPVDLKVSDLRYDIDGKFVVKGTAESMSTVFSLVDSMEKTPYFKDVKTRYTTKRKEGLRDVTDFEINCLLDR